MVMARPFGFVEEHVGVPEPLEHRGDDLEAALPEEDDALARPSVQLVGLVEEDALLEAGVDLHHVTERLAHKGTHVIVLERPHEVPVPHDAPLAGLVVVEARLRGAAQGDEDHDGRAEDGPDAARERIAHELAHLRVVVVAGPRLAHHAQQHVGAVERDVGNPQVLPDGVLVLELAREDVREDGGPLPHPLARDAQPVDHEAGERGGVVDELEVDTGDLARDLEGVEAPHLKAVVVDD